MSDKSFLDPSQYEIDSFTGYLQAKDKRVKKFSPQDKVRLLEVLEKTGDRAAACKLAGASARLLEAHLASDTRFKQDYEEVLAKMIGTLEGVMFSNGLKPAGFRDRMEWLKANCPEKYAPKVANAKDEGELKGAVNKLWDEVTGKKEGE